MGRQLHARVLEDAEQDRLRAHVLRGWRGVRVVGPVQRDVRDVGVAPAGHGDVQVLPSGRAGHDDMSGADGQPLGTVGGDGVAEVHVLGHVVGRQHDRSPGPHPESLGDHRAVLEDVRDAPPVPVLHPATTLHAELTVVAAGNDQVSDRGAGAVMEVDLPAGQRLPLVEPLGACPFVELDHGFGRLGDEDAAVAGA